MGFAVKGVLRRVLRSGSEKAVSKRCPVCPLGEYDPLGVRPDKKKTNQARKHINSGGENGVLAERGLCPLPKTGGFDENGENYEWTLYPQKQGLCPSDPENDENDENGRCHARKDPVC